MLKSEYPFYLANRPQTPNTDLAVTDKYTGETATRVPLASPEHIDAAIAASMCSGLASGTRVAVSPVYLSVTARSVFGVCGRLAR